jgi:hypothetical protein
MRVALGFLVAAAALAAAVWVHTGLKADKITTVAHTRLVYDPGNTVPRLAVTRPITVTIHDKSAWQDPLAIFLAVTGVGVGLAIVLPAVRRG